MAALNVIRIGLFILGGGAIALASRSSLRDPASHGFFRLFAFEALLALILWNLPRWFVDPFSARQIVSWLLLITSILLAVSGFSLLLTLGKPKRGIETTTNLVTNGLYRYIRHPLYSSLFFLTWGAFLKQITWISAILALAATLFLYLTARAEEGENLVRFGEDYAYYMQRTKRFIPFIF